MIGVLLIIFYEKYTFFAHLLCICNPCVIHSHPKQAHKVFDLYF